MSSFETIYRMNYYDGVVDLSDATGEQWKAIEKICPTKKELDDNTLSERKLLYINGH